MPQFIGEYRIFGELEVEVLGSKLQSRYSSPWASLAVSPCSYFRGI